MNNSFTKVSSRNFDGEIIEKYKLNEELSVDLISSVFRYFNGNNSLYAITCEFDGEDFNGFSQSSTCGSFSSIEEFNSSESVRRNLLYIDEITAFYEDDNSKTNVIFSPNSDAFSFTYAFYPKIKDREYRL